MDKTGLSARYDFDLEFTPDETQFGGGLEKGAEDSAKPGLFAAIQRQLGLKLEATRGLVDVLVIDRVRHNISQTRRSPFGVLNPCESVSIRGLFP